MDDRFKTKENKKILAFIQDHQAWEYAMPLAGEIIRRFPKTDKPVEV